MTALLSDTKTKTLTFFPESLTLRLEPQNIVTKFFTWVLGAKVSFFSSKDSAGLFSLTLKIFTFHFKNFEIFSSLFEPFLDHKSGLK